MDDNHVCVGWHLMPTDQTLEHCVWLAQLAESIIAASERYNLATWAGGLSVGDHILQYRYGLS